MKRLIDLFMSIVSIIMLSPVLLILVGLIKVTSRGPVVFKQKRIGKGKHEFYIYKFRTMYTNTPKDVPTHMLENPDKYITPIGKFLRRTSLDELPQLINILKGDMSFVGPRPALYNQYDLIELRDCYGVNNIAPGLTGWAQVNGRDELPIPVKVEYDKYYSDNKSIWLDIKILFITFINVISKKGIVEGKQTLDKNC
ncbi:MAG: sugar transferase [Clostridia bacterium]|nr:sugar transferase [Clostridia bacterium]